MKSSIRKSYNMSKLSKKKSYGYYCNLCQKYNLDRLKISYYKPYMILEIEKEQLNRKIL